MKRIIFSVISLILCLACAREEAELQVPVTDTVFYATLEQPANPETKVYADENLMVLWHADDRVSIFNHYTFNEEYRFTGETGDNAGSFSKVPYDDFTVGNELPGVYAVYPYQASTRISNQCQLTVTLPSEQVYAERSFGRGVNTMVSSTTDNRMLFKNVGGYLMLKLYGAGTSVSSVTLKGNNGELLAGKALVSAPFGGSPIVEMKADGSTREVTVTCPSPVSLGASADDYTEFWFVLPPTTFSKGFTVTVSGPNGSTFEKSTSKGITIERNTLSRMAAIEVKLDGGAVPPDNEIWYTTTDGSVVKTPSYEVSSFGSSIVSNTYENGHGIIIFDAPVTKIASYAFFNTKLNSILYPATVEEIGNYAFSRTGLSGVIRVLDSVRELGNGVFSECLSITGFRGHFASEDGHYLLDGSRLLAAADTQETVVIPSDVEIIGPSAFAGHTKIRSLVFDEEKVFFDSGSFEGSSLEGTLRVRGCMEDAFVGSRLSDLFSCGDTGLFPAYDIWRTMRGIGNTVLHIYSREAYEARLKMEDLIRYARESLEEWFRSEDEMEREWILDRMFRMWEENGCLSYDCGWEPESIYEAFCRLPELFRQEVVIIDADVPYGRVRYTTTDGKIITPDTRGIGAGIVSNTYDNGEGVILFDGPVYTIGGFTECETLASISLDEGVQELAAYAFRGCSNLVQIELPSTVETIGSYAFWDCRKLTRFDLPSSLKKIEACAFSHLDVWDRIDIPESVTDIDDGAFFEHSMKAFYGKGATEDHVSLIMNGTLVTLAYLTEAFDYVIPSSVIRIGGSAFLQSYVSTITIPETVVTITPCAVSHTRNLRAFYGKFASEDNRCLIVDNAVVAFAPSGINYYSIPNGITEIEDRAFSQWYSNLISIEIPNTVRRIGSQAFWYAHLVTVTLPASVEVIDGGAFKYCDRLQSVYVMRDTPPRCDYEVFDRTNDCPIYVPAQSVEAYRNAANWKVYASRIQAIPE